MIRHVIFDCFGTLIDTGIGSISAVEEILEHVNLKVDSKLFYSEWKSVKKEMMNSEPFICEKSLFQISLAKLFEKYGIVSDASIEVRPMINTLFATRNVFPDTVEALKRLELMDVDYAIGSTTDTDSILHYLEKNKLSISKVYTSEDMKVYKPSPKFYTTILDKTGWNIDECVFVGDSLIDDVYGPQAIGMKAILVDRKHTYQKDFDIIPNYIVEGLLEIMDIIYLEEKR